MRIQRRDFVRWATLGAVGALVGPRVARADRIRILGGGAGDGPGSPGTYAEARGGRPSVELARLLAAVHTGDVAVHGALRVLWLQAAPARGTLDLLTLDEAQSRGDLSIRERERPVVPELVVENRGKIPVLLLAGEILLGGKQNRVLAEDVLLPPLSGPRVVAVYCVEQGRWVGTASRFESKGSFAAPSLRSRVMAKADQSRVWREVERHAAAAAAPSATQSYQAIYDKPDVKARVGEAETRAELHAAPGAVGAAVFVDDRFGGLDVFDGASLFARQWRKLLRAYAIDAASGTGGPTLDPGALRARAAALLGAAAAAPGTWRSNAGMGQLFDFRVERHRGAALIADVGVVHTALL